MSEELTPPRFPTMLRKMWSGGEVQAWIDKNWNRRAHPAAPAAYIEGVNIDRLKEALTFLGAAYDSDEMLAARLAEHVNRLTQCVMRSKVLLAAPSTSTNGWLEAAVAWEVCASIHLKFAKGKDALFTVRQGDFVKHAADAREKATAPSVAPEPVEMRPYNPTEAMRWAAKRIDPALPHEHIRALWCVMWSAYAHPPRAPLTDAEIVSIMEACLNDWDWKEFARAVESAVRQEQPHG